MVWYLFSFGSAAFSSIAAILEKKVLFKENAMFYSFVLSLFNVVFSLPFIWFIDFAKVSGVALWVLFFKSFLGALSFFYVMKGLKNLQINNSLPLLVATPGLVAVFAFILLGETLGVFHILGLVLLLLGSYIINIESHKRLLDPIRVYIKTKGHHYIGIALLIFTFTSILDKVLLSKFKLPPTAFLLFQHIFLAFFFAIFVLVGYLFVKKYKKSVIASSVRLFKSKQSWQLLGLICLTGLVTIAYRYSHIMAVKLSFSVALALAMKRFSVLFAVIFGGRIFKEEFWLRRTLATLLMIIGAAFIIML